jgi:hypothetical protein
MHAIREGLLAHKLIVVASALTFAAGAGGMALSFLFLASMDALDVIAGAAGFVAGAILVAAGLLASAWLIRPHDVRTTAAVGTRGLEWSRIMDRWVAHFRRNRVNRPEPDWQAPITLPTDVVAALLPSLEQFQLGDGGGPAALIAWDADQLRASSSATWSLEKMWFTEEREHSRLLGAAVARFGGRPIHHHWSFTAFCLARKYFGVRFELTVLLLTEIVSTIYYRLLRRHAQDEALRSMCRLILRDESGHVALHRDRLAQAGDSRYGLWWEARFRLLGLGAASMLWVNHGPALCALGANTGEYYREVWLELSRFVRRLRREAKLNNTCVPPVPEVQAATIGQ